MRSYTAAVSLAASLAIAFVHGLQLPKDNTVGAVYFLTNGPQGNYIVANNIAPDGTLTFNSGTWAGGIGAHNNNTGTEPLFSQGAIKVSGNHIFAINAGSNTVSMFSIDRFNPGKLTMVGAPMPSGGEFPVSVDASTKGENVCVLNGGKVNGVNCFKADARRGLVQINDSRRLLGLNLTTPAHGPVGTVSQIMFNEDGGQVVAAVKEQSPTIPGYLAIWDVNPRTGALSKECTKISPPAPGARPFGMSIIPGKNAVVSTDPKVGATIISLDNANPSSTIPIPGQLAECWSARSNKTGNYYLTDPKTYLVTEVHVDEQLKGSIVTQYFLGNGSDILDNDVAKIGNEEYMYVLDAGTTAISVMSLDAPGQAKIIQNYVFASACQEANMGMEAKNLVGLAVFVRN